jgi:uncharacterized membrane protein
MNALTAWIFPTADGAEAALGRLRPLAEGGRISIDDAALLTWAPKRRKPKLRELGSLRGPGALWSGFWGLLLGMIFLVPNAGLTFGAAAGAIAGSLVEVGIDDAFITPVRTEIRPGTSALFVLCDAPTVDALGRELDALDSRLLRANLTDEEEQQLRTAFMEEEATA